MKKLIFLDFDGVLHGDATPKLARIDLFQDYFRRLPEVDVVISSTWREDYTLDELRTFFAVDVRPCIIATTPILTCGYDPAGRQREIEAWLVGAGLHEGAARWVALDDWEPYFEPGCPHLILVDGYAGFGDAEGEALLLWFGSVS